MLKELSEAFGVSGCEDEVREIIVEAIAEHVDDYRVDSLGNLIAVKKARLQSAIVRLSAHDEVRSPLKVMLAAHMDEVGLMITHIEKDGSLCFRPVGGIDDRILLSKVVLIGQDRILGVIGVKPIHLLKEKEREKVVKVEEMVVDIGASSREEAEKLVKPGDYAAFATKFVKLGNTVKGKAFDDRAGCAVLIELLKEHYPFDLYAAFTVQEEVGLRGARVAAYAIKPDVAFVLEGTICDDLPKKRDVSPTTRLGGGPAITIMDRTFIADRRLVDLLVESAEENNIPYQFKQPVVGGTDAGAIHLTKEGVPSAAVAIPCRYIHSPACLLSLNDFDNTVKLMKGALARFTSQWVNESTRDLVTS